MVSNEKPEGSKEDALANEARVWINSLFCSQYINEYIISLHPAVGKGENGALPTPHLQDTISTVSASSGSGENQ